MKSFRNIRVIPVVLIAILGLAMLKVAGLVIDGGYVFDHQQKQAKKSWAQETFNFPSAGKADPGPGFDWKLLQKYLGRGDQYFPEGVLHKTSG